MTSSNLEAQSSGPLTPPRWAVPARVADSVQRELGVDSLLLAQLLWNRSLRTASEVASFLEPQGSPRFGDPASMLGLPEAVRRLLKATRSGEQIAIYGDYDVDGLAGTALLVSALRSVGANVVAHIPDRARDGYGVQADAVRRLAAGGARVIVTVDCGISANREVELAADLGVDAIVTDHHTLPARLPSALAVLNPHQGECEYPFKELAGGGVAFQLGRALLHAMLDREEAAQLQRGLLAFAALSTVADVVGLVGENRQIVAGGLGAIRSGAVPGLQAICDSAGRALYRLSARDLAFTLIPRLNAAGRMGDARRALDLLLAADVESARELAADLETANAARRQQTQEILSAVGEEALSMAQSGWVVLAGDYPVGLAGLIAGRLAERFAAPCVVIERGAEVSRGSARGIDGIHLVQALEVCAPSLIQYGGHAKAAGFTLRSELIEDFRARFAAAIRTQRGDARAERTIPADAQIRLGSVGHRLARLVDRFEPVGAGNPPPTFISRGLSVLSVERASAGRARLRVAQGAAVRHAVAFGSDLALPDPGARVDLLYEIDRMVWDTEERVDMVVRDLRLATA